MKKLVFIALSVLISISANARSMRLECENSNSHPGQSPIESEGGNLMQVSAEFRSSKFLRMSETLKNVVITQSPNTNESEVIFNIQKLNGRTLGAYTIFEIDQKSDQSLYLPVDFDLYDTGFTGLYFGFNRAGWSNLSLRCKNVQR